MFGFQTLELQSGVMKKLRSNSSICDQLFFVGFSQKPLFKNFYLLIGLARRSLHDYM